MSVQKETINSKPLGGLEVIIGNMFSGKTSYLLRELNIYSILGLKVLYVNNNLDTRSSKDFSTHNPIISSKGNIDSISLGSVNSKTQKIILEYDVIGIDEAQFFLDLTKSVLELVEKYKKRVLVAGLCADFKREKFGEILNLVPYCDSLIKLSSFCIECSKNNIIREAQFSYLKPEKNEPSFSATVVIGGNDKYTPLCRECYLKNYIPPKPDELLKKAKKILEMFFSYFDLEYKIGQNELKCIAEFLKTSDDVEKKVKDITRDLFRKNISFTYHPNDTEHIEKLVEIFIESY